MVRVLRTLRNQDSPLRRFLNVVSQWGVKSIRAGKEETPPAPLSRGEGNGRGGSGREAKTVPGNPEQTIESRTTKDNPTSPKKIGGKIETTLCELARGQPTDAPGRETDIPRPGNRTPITGGTSKCPPSSRPRESRKNGQG